LSVVAVAAAKYFFYLSLFFSLCPFELKILYAMTSPSDVLYQVGAFNDIPIKEIIMGYFCLYIYGIYE
jgi:hypothetical protein